MNKKIFLLIVLFLSITALVSGCTSNNNKQEFDNVKSVQTTKNKTYTPSSADFSGEKDQKVSIIDNQISLDSKIFDDGLAHFYNTQLNGKTTYFFVLKDNNDVYRAAANACQVCYDARMGFRQEGDFMVCNTCGNKYPLEKIATEKGGCNPGPINPNLEMQGPNIIVEQQDLEQVAELF
ncbi:MAG: DUF2318 domain-containing protein [Candidatus Kuenenbacteria bacterium]